MSLENEVNFLDQLLPISNGRDRTVHFDRLRTLTSLSGASTDPLSCLPQSLVTFANKQLNKINLEVTDLDTQFNDGVYLCLLMGLLEDYFVPLYDFHLTPRTFEDKVGVGARFRVGIVGQ